MEMLSLWDYGNIDSSMFLLLSFFFSNIYAGFLTVKEIQQSLWIISIQKMELFLCKHILRKDKNHRTKHVVIKHLVTKGHFVML